jgi:hypothetical protein
MPNTYTQLFVQVIFAVKRRQSLIPKQHRDTLHKYMTAVIQMIITNCCLFFACPITPIFWSV